MIKCSILYFFLQINALQALQKFVKICESYQAKDIEKYKYTMAEIEKSTPIIHQAVLHDPVSKIYGCVDLLVRSDWLNKIFINYICI